MFPASMDVTQCWHYAGSATQAMVQHEPRIGLMSRASWD